METRQGSIRKLYIAKLIFRCIVLAVCIWIFVTDPSQYDIIDETAAGPHLFSSHGPSFLHFLWCVWVLDMLGQLIPIKGKIPLGSQKLFAFRFRAGQVQAGQKDHTSLHRYIRSANRSAYLIFFLWAVLTAAIGLAHHKGILSDRHLFLITVFFYVCDLICVLIWCPFRLILGNKCCTTCRIFNWDHLMMFSPFFFMRGAYPLSLLAMSIAIWLLWEYSVYAHPERFWEHTNTALHCSACTDKLCTQYCKKRDKM